MNKNQKDSKMWF